MNNFNPTANTLSSLSLDAMGMNGLAEVRKPDESN